MNFPLAEMLRLLSEIDEALPRASWKPAPSPNGTNAYEGVTSDGWRFLVIDFPVDGHFYRPGRGYDGTAVLRGTTVIRFTQDRAKRAYDLALTGAPKRDTVDSGE
jgi:hypothetical protein